MANLNTARNPAELYSEISFVLFVCFCILISFSSSTPPQHRLQMPDFLIYFTRLRDRVGDHFTQKFSIAAAQPVNGHVHRANADAAAGGEFYAWSGALFTGQGFLEEMKEIALAIAGIVFAQAGH